VILSGWFLIQTVVMMLMVVIGYTLAWLPLNLFQLYMVRPSEESPLPHIETVFFSVHWLAMAHTAYNPLIYAWMNIRFRSAFLQVNPVSRLIANMLSCPRRVVQMIEFVQVLRNCLPWGKDKYGQNHHGGRLLNGSSGQRRTLKSVILTRGHHSSHGGNNNLHTNGNVCGLLEKNGQFL
jgi:hypothetical protein